MEKNRLEAFSDGVIAIIITIMVLELKVPHDASAQALLPKVPVFLSYILSFLYVAIYWNNHHHLFAVVKQINGTVLWANIHLLFWLSLIPFVTAWCGENHFVTVPVAAYGVVLLMCAVAYYILVRSLLAMHDGGSKLARAIGSDRKGKVSAVIYAVAIPLAFYSSDAALVLYAVVASFWLVPDPRIEKKLVR